MIDDSRRGGTAGAAPGTDGGKPRFRIAVLQLPGVNCEHETARALAAAGLDAEIVRWTRSDLDHFAGFVLPGRLLVPGSGAGRRRGGAGAGARRRGARGARWAAGARHLQRGAGAGRGGARAGPGRRGDDRGGTRAERHAGPAGLLLRLDLRGADRARSGLGLRAGDARRRSAAGARRPWRGSLRHPRSRRRSRDALGRDRRLSLRVRGRRSGGRIPAQSERLAWPMRRR